MYVLGEIGSLGKGFLSRFHETGLFPSHSSKRIPDGL